MKRITEKHYETLTCYSGTQPLIPKVLDDCYCEETLEALDITIEERDECYDKIAELEKKITVGDFEGLAQYAEEKVRRLKLEDALKDILGYTFSTSRRSVNDLMAIAEKALKEDS
jgi:hypothetical protein